MAGLVRFISLGLCLHFVAGTTCLQNAVTTRKDLVNAKGESYPVGLAYAYYASAQVLVEIARIAIQEILGYNTQLTGYGSTPATLRALFGCTNPDDTSDNSGCSDGNTRSHVLMDSWTSGYESDFNQLVNTNPNFAAFRASNLFNSLIGMYIGKAVWEQKTLAPLLDTKEGLHEDGQPWTYFDPISDFDTSKLMPCTATLLTDDNIMRSYLTITGDTAGVSLTSEGYYVGVCHADSWWLAPGECRTSSGLRCVPMITGGSGWALEELMQKATVWQIPLAIGVASDWTAYTELPKSKKCLFYWWEPDREFPTLEPKLVTFPAHDAAAWATANKTTANLNGMIENLVSYDLPDLAPDVYGFVYNFQMSMDTMRGMMRDVASGTIFEEAACQWTKQNEDVLRSFIPDTTKSTTGTGSTTESTESTESTTESTTGSGQSPQSPTTAADEISGASELSPLQVESMLLTTAMLLLVRQEW